MSECCIDNGVPEACLGLCSTQYALWSRSVMNIPECLFALPTIFQCGIGKLNISEIINHNKMYF